MRSSKGRLCSVLPKRMFLFRFQTIKRKRLPHFGRLLTYYLGNLKGDPVVDPEGSKERTKNQIRKRKSGR